MDVVGGYQLLDRVAVTATAARWRGRDTAHDRDVCVRLVAGGAVATVDHPRSGVRVLAGLSHPNIVGLLDKIEADGQIWLIDEPADGITLDTLLASLPPGSWPTPQQSFAVVRGVLQGLAYVHTSRALHGDINPSTVLINAAGVARLTDFGLPAPTERADTRFLSPEAASGLGLSPRSDVYSVGALLALLVGEQVDGGVRAVLDRALAKDPTERYLDAEQFLEALEDAAELSFGDSWLAQRSIVELIQPEGAD